MASGSASVPRPEHPNPIFERRSWINLNGRAWEFAIQPAKHEDPPDEWAGRITVPFCLQAALSGALDQLSKKQLRDWHLRPPPLAPGLRKCDALWYRRRLPSLPKAWREDEELRVLLHVGACDSAARVAVNGIEFPEHRGGSTAFTHDITEALRRPRRAGCGADGYDEVLVRCTDGAQEGKLEPCGKQLACNTPYSGEGPHVPTLYSNVSGIWQTVWLEAVPARAHLERVQVVPLRPKTAAGAWRLELRPALAAKAERAGLVFEATLFSTRSRRNEIVTGKLTLAGRLKPCLTLVVPAAAARPWSPEDPHLYGLRLRLRAGGEVIDEVQSYAALRTVECSGDEILLNGCPRYMRLVLDQGYYPDGLWTAPSEAALRRDITLAMGMGFNGARLHQKVFEPLYFSIADELGFLVISEYPDWVGGRSCRWEVTPEYRELVEREWCDCVARLHNHPSIIAWGIFNEFGPKGGWRHNIGAGGGFWSRYTPAKRLRLIRSHCDFVRRVARRVRRGDAQRRPVHDSSGWIHVKTDVWLAMWKGGADSLCSWPSTRASGLTRVDHSVARIQRASCQATQARPDFRRLLKKPWNGSATSRRQSTRLPSTRGIAVPSCTMWSTRRTAFCCTIARGNSRFQSYGVSSTAACNAGAGRRTRLLHLRRRASA
eukprot:TRINITY_DN17929_c0_g1_i1.p1 TRINITY_DN17929_c0_g1~~TRINITY_DN17929_c0_g1_i1.p1  ORF type:complete len:691 (-),score=102.39 TRINITY_DN17929_c0_g1_i1:40-2016(-)